MSVSQIKVVGWMCLIFWLWSFASPLFINKAHSSGIPVIDVSNIAQTLITAQNSVKQVENQLKMLEDLGFDSSADISKILNQTQSLLNEIEGISYGLDDVEEDFEKIYPENAPEMSLEQIRILKDDLLVQTREAQKHAMRLQASIANSIPETQNTVNNLVARSNAASGATAATQANSQLLATMSMQLSQTQTLLMSQTRSLNSFIQEQNTRAEAAKRSRENFYQGAGGDIPARSDGYDPLNYGGN